MASLTASNSDVAINEPVAPGGGGRAESELYACSVVHMQRPS